MTLIAAQIFDGVATREECFTLINRYSPQMQTYEGPTIENPYHRHGFEAGQFFEIREEEYWYFLEVLPPLAMTLAGFAMSEFTTGNLTNAFFKINGGYYCMTIAVDASGPDAAVNKAGRAIRAAQEARFIPTSAFLKWARLAAVEHADPPLSEDEVTRIGDEAVEAIFRPTHGVACGQLVSGDIAFFENGAPWRFSHMGPDNLPASIWFFPPVGPETMRKDALDAIIAVIVKADGEGA